MLPNRYHYYRVTVPGDAFNDIKEAAEAAINEARERAKLYITPALWSVHKHVSGVIGDSEITFVIRRKTRCAPRRPKPNRFAVKE